MQLYYSHAKGFQDARPRHVGKVAVMLAAVILATSLPSPASGQRWSLTMAPLATQAVTGVNVSLTIKLVDADGTQLVPAGATINVTDTDGTTTSYQTLTFTPDTTTYILSSNVGATRTVSIVANLPGGVVVPPDAGAGTATVMFSTTPYILSLSPATTNVYTGHSLMVTASLVDISTYTNPVAMTNKRISFNVGGNLPATAVTNDAGKASITFSNTAAGPTTVTATATITSTTSVGTIQDVAVTFAPPAYALTLDPPVISVIAGTTTTVTATLTDPSRGVPLAQKIITFAVTTDLPPTKVVYTATTNANGQAVLTFTNAAPASTVVSAKHQPTAGEVVWSSQYVAAIFTTRPTYSLTLSPVVGSALAGDPVTITATLTDVTLPASPQLLSGEVVTFTATGNTATPTITGTATTNAAGVASFTLSRAAPGSYSVSAATTTSITSQTVASAAPIMVTFDPRTYALALAASNTNPIAGTSAVVQATLTDVTVSTTSPNLVAGEVVIFTATGGSPTPATNSITTNAAGVATFSFSSATAGTSNVAATATVLGQTVNAAAIAITFNANAYSLTFVAASVTVARGTSAVVRTTLQDVSVPTSPKVVSGQLVTFTAVGTAVTPTTGSATTNTQGVASFTLTTNTAGSVQVAATATIAGTGQKVSTTGDATVTFLPTYTISINPANARRSLKAQQTVTATVMNRTDATTTTPVSVTPVTFRVTGVAAQTKVVNTSTNGVATFSFTSLTVTGLSTVTATAAVPSSVTPTITSTASLITWK